MMDNILNFFTNDNITDFIITLSSIMTSFIIAYITIHYNNKSNRKILDEQNKLHEQNLSLEKEKHKDTLRKNEEIEILKYQPFLALIPLYEEDRFNAKLVYNDKLKRYEFPFILKNEGAWSAFNIHLKYLDTLFPQFDNELCVVAYNNYSNQIDMLGTALPIDKSILSVGKEADFCLYLNSQDTKCKDCAPLEASQWYFSILYTDNSGREYEQTYSFLSDLNDKMICRVYSNIPKLI